MSDTAKLIGFLAILLLAFTLAFGVGKLFAPSAIINQAEHAASNFAASPTQHG